MNVWWTLAYAGLVIFAWGAGYLQGYLQRRAERRREERWEQELRWRNRRDQTR